MRKIVYPTKAQYPPRSPDKVAILADIRKPAKGLTISPNTDTKTPWFQFLGMKATCFAECAPKAPKEMEIRRAPCFRSNFSVFASRLIIDLFLVNGHIDLNESISSEWALT